MRFARINPRNQVAERNLVAAVGYLLTLDMSE